MGKSESTRETERGGNLVVGGDGTIEPGVEIVQLPNAKIDVVKEDGVVLLQVIEGDKGKSSREIPPKDVDGRAGVLGRAHNMHVSVRPL